MGVNLVLLTEHLIKNMQDLEHFTNSLSERKNDFLFEFDKGSECFRNLEIRNQQYSTWNLDSPLANSYFDSLENYWKDPDFKYYEILTPENAIFYICIYKHIFSSPNAVRWFQFSQNPAVHHQIRKACFELNREFEHDFIYVPDSMFDRWVIEELTIDNANLNLEQVKHEFKQRFGSPAPIGWLIPWDDIIPLENPIINNHHELTRYDNYYYVDDFSDFKFFSRQLIIEKINEIIDYTCFLHHRYSIQIPVKGIISLNNTANISSKELGSDLKNACDLLRREELDSDLNKHNIQILTNETQTLNWPNDFM